MTSQLANARLLIVQRLRSHRVPEPEQLRPELRDRLLPHRRAPAQRDGMASKTGPHSHRRLGNTPCAAKNGHPGPLSGWEPGPHQ